MTRSAPRSYELHYQILKDDFVRAHRAHLRRTLITVKNFILVSFALGIGVIQSQMFGNVPWLTLVFGTLWAAILVLMLYAFWILPARLYRFRHDGTPDAGLIANDKGLRIINHSGTKGYAWSRYSYWSDLAGILLIHLKSGAPIPIPTTAFRDTDQIREFVEFLDKKRDSEATFSA